MLELGGVGSRAAPNGLSIEKAGGAGKISYQDYYDQRYFTRDAPAPQQRATPANAPQQRPPPQPSISASSVSSAGSSNRGGFSEEKKKKRGLFHF